MSTHGFLSYPTNNNVLRRYLWRVAGNDPRYKNFLLAQGIQYKEAHRDKLFDSLSVKHGERMKQYMYFWDLYFGNHWFNVSEENLDPLKVNYCYVTVNKNVSFLMNKGFKVTSQFPEIEKFLQRNWQLNDAGTAENLFGTANAIQAGVTGDTFYSVKFAQHPIYNTAYIKYELIDSLDSYPVLDKEEMIGFLDYGKKDKVVKENYGFAEYKESFEGYYYGRGNQTRIVEDNVVGTIDFALPEIPIIHISNFPVPTSFYGLSDLTTMHDLNLIMNRMLTDIQDIIDYHAQPITVLKGAKVNQLTRGANRIWSIPKDADISNLKLEGELVASAEQLKRIRENIAEVTNVPEGTVGKVPPISNTSASALAIAFMPLYETMEFKRTVFGIGFLRTNAVTLKMSYLRQMLSPNQIIKNALDRWEGQFSNYSEKLKNKFYPFHNKINPDIDYDSLEAFYGNLIPPELYMSSIEWQPPLLRDESILTDNAIAKVNSQLWSRKYARTKIGMSELDSRLMDEQIEAEKELYGEKTIVTNENTGMEGSPDVKGNNESKRQQKRKDSIDS